MDYLVNFNGIFNLYNRNREKNNYFREGNNLFSDKYFLQCKFNFNRENIFSIVIKILTLETK
jgi:hypothetical protein